MALGRAARRNCQTEGEEVHFWPGAGKQLHKPSIILSPGDALTHRTVSGSSEEIQTHGPMSRLAGREGVSLPLRLPPRPEQREASASLKIASMGIPARRPA